MDELAIGGGREGEIGRMGCTCSKDSCDLPLEPIPISAPVTLNIYDLTPFNKYTYCFGLGIYHSGIEVYGLEYGFGAHDYPSSGVFEVEPKRCPGFSYRRSITLGTTNMLPFEFREFIETLAGEYNGDTYHLILKNCNHFTNDLAFRLTGKPIPKWVNRLADMTGVCGCILPKNLRIAAVEENSETYGLLDDASGSYGLISPLEEESNASESVDHDDKCILSPSSAAEMPLIRKEEVTSQSQAKE